jgi:hypothetical protein
MFSKFNIPKYSAYAIGMILAIVLLVLIRSCDIKPIKSIKKDSITTVKKFVKIKPRDAYNKVKKVFRRKQVLTKDTIIETPPFKVEYKDSTNGNINHFTYLFPQDTVIHHSKPAPDTTKIYIEKTKVETEIVKEESSVWMNIVYILSGGFLTILINGIF